MHPSSHALLQAKLPPSAALMPFFKQSSQRRPSRHVFVSIEGIQQTGVVAAAEAVQAVFAPFAGGGCSDDGGGSLVVTPGPDPHGRLWTASFTRGPQGEAAAAAALAAVSGKPCAGLQGRVVTCKYAKWVSDEHSTQEERQLLEDAGEQQQPPLQAPPVALTTEQANIPGLLVLHDFVSAAQEAQLLAHIEQQPWQHLAKRRVQHYGYVFEYSQRGVDLKQQAGAIPPWSHDLVQRLQALPDVPQLDQLTVNEYTPGVGIAPHVDAHSSFTGAITALSLLGSCVMVFRKGYTASTNPDRIHLPHVQASLQQQQQRRQEHGQQQGVEQQQQQQDQQVHVFLPPRTLVVMAGECRYGWQHYIPHRKSDLVNGQHIPRAERRVSLTFRQVRGFPCKCSYPECCDSQDGVLPLPRVAELQQQQQQQPSGQCAQQERQQPPAACNGHAANTAASNSSNSSDSSSTSTATACEEARLTAAAAADRAALVEDVHVHQVYDAIASHFSSTRFAVWPKVRAFLESLQPGSVVADVGCGNGKYLGVRRDLAVLGCDRSAGLAAVAAHRLGTTTSSISSVPAAPPGADVLVCDALALAYRPSSCDAALCIAVLHHISSRQRRVELLAQLGAVLRPGGRGLVTVWATLQEDPAKTIQRWHKIQEGSSSSQGGQQQQQEGPDFLVPWHLPFHRAGGLQLQQQQAVGAGSAGGDGSSQSSMAPARPAAAGTPGGGMRLDAAKGAVVLQRYYHLFEQGELEGLVREVPGLQVLDSFYDRSNWCVVFGRSTSEGAGSAEGCV